MSTGFIRFLSRAAEKDVDNLAEEVRKANVGDKPEAAEGPKAQKETVGEGGSKRGPPSTPGSVGKPPTKK